MNLPRTLALSTAFLALVALTVGCAATGSPLVDSVNEQWKAISADGVLTPEELKAFSEVLKSQLSEGAGRIDWLTQAGTALAGIVASFLGINLYRGPRADPAVK